MVILLLLVVPLAARDLGTFGEVFPIAERSLVEVIASKLQKLEESGQLLIHQENIQKRIASAVTRPQSVLGVQQVANPRIFLYDPSITVTRDMADHEGKVFYKAGQVVNPLATHSLTKPLLFIDGEVPSNITWVLQKLKQYPFAKLILVSGSPFKLMQELDMQVYFDQKGKLTSKFGIRAVPAIVTQSQDKLQVSEELPHAA